MCELLVLFCSFYPPWSLRGTGGFFCPSWKGFQSRNTWYLWLIHFCISWSFLSGDMTCEQEQATWAMMLSLPLIKIMSGLYLSVSPEPSISKYQSAFVFNEPNLETATVLPRRDFPNKKHKCWRHSAGQGLHRCKSEPRCMIFNLV